MPFLCIPISVTFIGLFKIFVHSPYITCHCWSKSRCDTCTNKVKVAPICYNLSQSCNNRLQFISIKVVPNQFLIQFFRKSRCSKKVKVAPLCPVNLEKRALTVSSDFFMAHLVAWFVPQIFFCATSTRNILNYLS